MKFETIIFLVILFNVVTAFLQRRAKKAKEKRRVNAGDPPALQPATIRGKSKEKAVSLGKDLLGQIAKELGLRLPETESEPEPVIESIPLHPPLRMKPAPEFSGDGGDDKDPDVATVSVMSQSKPAPELMRKTSPFGLDMGKMREAVILSEILNKPVSLRSGRFK